MTYAYSEKEMAAWVERNEESLRAEYRAYAVQHDYDLDGVRPFASWVRIQWDNHMLELKLSIGPQGTSGIPRLFI